MEYLLIGSLTLINIALSCWQLVLVYRERDVLHRLPPEAQAIWLKFRMGAVHVQLMDEENYILRSLRN